MKKWKALAAFALACMMIIGTVFATGAEIPDPSPSDWKFELNGVPINFDSVVG